MKAAILRKARESAELTAQFFEKNAPLLESCVRELAARFERGGRLFTMGNGGSACDAAHLAVELQHPIIEKRRALPAHQLGANFALLTAIGNDTDFSRVFVEELELVAKREDAVLGISTSGASGDVNRAMRRARELGLLRIGFSGRDGGPMRELVDYCFVVESWSIHRIQEVHTILLHLLWDQLHVCFGEDDVI